MNMNIEKCKKWIKKNKRNFIDDCNEYDYTGIGEALAEDLELYVNDDIIPDEVFDLVMEVV